MSSIPAGRPRRSGRGGPPGPSPQTSSPNRALLANWASKVTLPRSAPRRLSLSAIVGWTSGGVAQLVERLHGMQEVREFDSPRLHQKARSEACAGRWGELLGGLGDILGDVSFRKTGVDLSGIVGGSKSDVPRALGGNPALVG
jgi:hypothetical protein